MTTVSNDGNKCCSFCRNLKITLPHDHTIRDFTQKNSPIMCPKLLNSVCGYCRENGHTPGYCPVLKAKKDGNYRLPPSNSEISFHKKRVHVIDKDGFISIPSRGFEIEEPFVQKKVQKMNVLIGAYAALNVDDINETDELNCPINSSNQKLKDMIGIKKNSRWSDEPMV